MPLNAEFPQNTHTYVIIAPILKQTSSGGEFIMRFGIVCSIILLCFAFFAGCSTIGRSGVTPDEAIALPDMQNPGTELFSTGTLIINPSSMAVENQADRVSDYVYNITGFLPNKCAGGCFRFRILEIQGTVLKIELTVENPTNFQVYDLRVEYLNTYGKTVLNPDSYTDFLGRPNLVIKPFTAFAKENADRAFPVGPGGIDTEILYLDFPPGSSSSVNYAITASYSGKCGEPYEINGMGQSGALTPSGGSAIISCDALDHQGNISGVYLDARTFTGSIAQMLPDPSDPERYAVTISNAQGAPIGDYMLAIKAMSANPQNISTYNFATVSVTPEMTGGLVVFQKDFGYIYTLNPDGSNMTNLGIMGYYPCISQSNNIIVYISSYSGNLRACDIDGTDDRLIANGPYLYPSVTADGSKIVFYDNASPSHCFIVNSDGSGFRQLSPIDDTNSWKYASIAGSGNRVAMLMSTSPYSIYVCDPDGANLSLVKQDVDYCTITYDGEWVYYTDPFEIHRIRHDGTDNMAVAYTAATSRFGMTPDGSKVSYTLWFDPNPPQDYGNDLMVMDVNTGIETRLTWGAMNAGSNTLTNDGSWVIFDGFAVGPMQSIKTDGSMNGVPILLGTADYPSCNGTIAEHF